MPAPAAPALVATLYLSQGYVRLHVTFPAGPTGVDVYRVGPSGVRGYVRGAKGAALAAGVTSFDVVDYETPFGLAVTYYAVVRNGSGDSPASAGVVVTVDVDDDWLVDLDDARNTGPVYVESFAELEYEAPQGVHRILGRRTPIVTSDLRWTPSGRLVLVTLDVAAARRVRDALGSSSPLLLRSRFERGVGNMYLLARTVAEQRISRLATEPARRWQVDVVEIDRPDPSLYLPLGVSYAEIAAQWATYAAAAAARPDYGALAYDRTGLPSAAVYSSEPAFPTRDV